MHRKVGKHPARPILTDFWPPSLPGPSFFLGLSNERGTSSNPLKQVLDAVGEEVPSKQYDRVRICFASEGIQSAVFSCDVLCLVHLGMGSHFSYMTANVEQKTRHTP